MIYDAMYLEDEYPKYVGWGHSTPAQALDLAARSGVGIPMIFHHDPSRGDDALDTLARELDAQLPGAMVATQGQTIHLTNGKVEVGTRRAA